MPISRTRPEMPMDAGAYWTDIVDGDGNVTGIGEVDIMCLAPTPSVSTTRMPMITLQLRLPAPYCSGHDRSGDHFER